MSAPTVIKLGMTIPGHATEIRKFGRCWVPSCVCGWTVHPVDKKQARLDCFDHISLYQQSVKSEESR